MLRKLPSFVVKGFTAKFLQLAKDPYNMAGVDTIKNPTSIGIPERVAYRIRVEDYRATYTITEDTIVTYIYEIEHRSKVCRKQ